jgi:methionyl-tRNA formyltransferase
MRIVFIGTGEIGRPTLGALRRSNHQLVGVVTQPDKPAGREQRLTAPPIKRALFDTAIPVLQPKRINQPEAIDQIHALAPELIVVMAYGQILPSAILKIPQVACLNLHASLLPRWRGAAPIQAAIAAGDCETGITVMYMDEGLDTGDILLQRKVEIARNETGGSLHDRLAKLAPEPLLESLALLEKGTAPRTRQNNQLATFAPKLKRDDGRIDWNEPAEVIERKIRAFNPWPGAYTDINGRHLKIFAATLVSERGRPGQLLRMGSELIIAAADGALAVLEVQLEGKKRMSTSAFLRGAKL